MSFEKFNYTAEEAQNQFNEEDEILINYVQKIQKLKAWKNFINKVKKNEAHNGKIAVEFQGPRGPMVLEYIPKNKNFDIFFGDLDKEGRPLVSSQLQALEKVFKKEIQGE